MTRVRHRDSTARTLDEFVTRLETLERRDLLSGATSQAGLSHWRDANGLDQVTVGLNPADGVYEITIGQPPNQLKIIASGPNAGSIAGGTSPVSSGNTQINGTLAVAGTTQFTGAVTALASVAALTQILGVQSLSYATSITPSAVAGDLVLVGILTGAVTVNAPTSPAKGAQLILHFQQDATGGRVVTLASNYKVTWTPSTSANLRNVIRFICVDAVANTWVQAGAASTGLPA